MKFEEKLNKLVDIRGVWVKGERGLVQYKDKHLVTVAEVVHYLEALREAEKLYGNAANELSKFLDTVTKE